MEFAQIGRYEIHTLLGQGGMGTVYKARDPLMERWVAIKTVTVQDARQRARFQQEVQAAGKLNHPHIITVYDVGEQGELAYIVMELVEGKTLTSRLSTPIPWSEAVELLLPICQALAYAHSRGVIHRDVKPANILISTAGQVKLTDFGVARLETALRRITESGSIVGTPLYTTPEQLRNEAVDGRADLFSVGIVLFELIAGQHPFPGETLPQVVYRITQPEPANLEPLVAVAPQPVVDLVGRAVSKNPAARFANIEEMAEMMERCLAQPNATLPPPSRPTPSPDPILSRPVIEIVPGDLRLSPAEELLLRKAFASHDRVYLEREFSSGYSGARVLLVTPVRGGGRRLAQVILKLDTPTAIDQEWRAYQKYVQDTLPPVTARILEEPLYATKGGQLALLRYTFAGGLGSAAPESLQTYYAQHQGQEIAALLEKNLFRSFGAKWWLQRQSSNLILRREYDRLLPVHLMIAPQELSETMPTLRTLVAGQTSATDCRELEVGQIVQLQGFTVAEIEADQGQFTLQALPPSGYSPNPIRVRVTGLKADSLKYQVGETFASFLGIVTATRRRLLYQRAEPAWPGQNLDQKQVAIGGRHYPNPLYDYEALLDQRVSAMRSIIHGDLNLQNILVTPGSGLVWLIDFATTREGHNLDDFMRLETQVVTKLLPQTQVNPETVVRMMYLLHQSDASPRQVPTQLRKPFVVLAAIRQMVRVCMYNREQWDEYYLGLVIMLLGTLKFKELDPATRNLVLAAAAAVRGMITIPALQITPAPTPIRDSSPLRLWPKIAAVVGSLALFITLIGSALWFSGLFSPDRSNSTPPAVTTVAAIVSTKSLTPTSSPTSTPSPSPAPPDHGEGIILSSVEIRSGPGFDYPALDAVTIGDAVQITGRSVNGKWLQIAFSNDAGEYGWLPAEYIKLTEVIVPRVATARPPPTMTFTPTPQPTATPTITPTPSPTLTFTLTPTATPTPCPIGPAAEFQALWDAYGAELGCPTGPLEVIPTLAEELFEGGHMFWRSDTDEVYVVYDRQRDDGAILTNGSWEHYPFPWDGTIPPGVGPTPPDRIEPQSGFGWLWRAKLGGPDGPLGWAMDKEYGFDNIGRVQPFENGRVFKGSDPKIYILLDGGRFFVYDPAQRQ